MEDNAPIQKNEREKKDIILNKITCMKKSDPNIEKTKLDQKNLDENKICDDEDYYAVLLNEDYDIVKQKKEPEQNLVGRDINTNAKCCVKEGYTPKNTEPNLSNVHDNRDKSKNLVQNQHENKHQNDRKENNLSTKSNTQSKKIFYNNQIQDDQVDVKADQQTNKQMYNNKKNLHKVSNNMSSIEMNQAMTYNKNFYDYKINSEMPTSSQYNEHINGNGCNATFNTKYNDTYLDNGIFESYLLTENVTYYPNPYDYQLFSNSKQNKTYPFNFKKKYSTLLKERNFYEPLVFISDDKDLENKYLKKEELTTKPPYSYSQLITKALESNSENIMTLSEIYAWIKNNFEYYKKCDTTWQNSIRHNLSLNKSFKKVPRPSNKPGKGGFWSIDYDSIASDDSKKLKRRSKEDYMKKELTNDFYYKDNMFPIKDYYYNDFTKYNDNRPRENYDKVLYNRYNTTIPVNMTNEDFSETESNEQEK